jgi:DNA primase
VVNFDPDAAGANATEKSISLLTEEGFSIRIVTLDGGLDPDRYIRERGVEAYLAAVRAARSQADYLIERARQMFPGGSADQKVKAMNYLLPHIRMVPQDQARIQFARDAAKQLLIDFPTLQGEMERAARRRLDHVGAQIARDVGAFRAGDLAGFSPAVLERELREAESLRRGGFSIRTGNITEVERILIRALEIVDPEHNDARRLALEAITGHPEWFQHLNSFPAMQLLTVRRASEGIEAIEDSHQRALVAEALLNEVRPPSEVEVRGALDQMNYKWVDKQFLEVEAMIKDANQRGDFAEEIRLAQQRLTLVRERHRLTTEGGNAG